MDVVIDSAEKKIHKVISQCILLLSFNRFIFNCLAILWILLDARTQYDYYFVFILCFMSIYSLLFLVFNLVFDIRVSNFES